MRKNNHDDLAGRQAAASEARAALLKSHKTAQDAAEPERLARQEQRVTAAAAKSERQAERTRLKAEELERVRAAEGIGQTAGKDVAPEPERTSADVDPSSADPSHTEAEPDAGKNKAKKRAMSPEQEAAMQKAERDRRYANRKSRQRK